MSSSSSSSSSSGAEPIAVAVGDTDTNNTNTTTNNNVKSYDYIVYHATTKENAESILQEKKFRMPTQKNGIERGYVCIFALVLNTYVVLIFVLIYLIFLVCVCVFVNDPNLFIDSTSKYLFSLYLRCVIVRIIDYITPYT